MATREDDSLFIGEHEQGQAVMKAEQLDAPPNAPSSPSLPNLRKRKACGTGLDVSAYFHGLDEQFRDKAENGETRVDYDPLSEPTPMLPQYCPEFAEAERQLAAIIRELHQAILQHPKQDAEAKYMCDRLNDVEKPLYPGAMVIGILGGSGVGKSTLVNAILAIEGLCPISETDAGTLVPMELVQMSPDQPTPFAATIELYTLDECQIIIRSALRDYYIQFVVKPDDENGYDQDQVDLGTPALKILVSIFAGYDEFESYGAAHGFLKQLESEDDPQILGQLMGWTTSLYGDLSTIIDKGPIYAHSAKELALTIEPFVQTATVPFIEVEENRFLECSVWAFVKLARVSLDSIILSKGVIMTDLPGTTDTNVYRVRGARRYLRRCDFIFVVRSKTRAGDDPTFKNDILTSHRLKKSGNVAAIVTQLDNISKIENMQVPLTIEENSKIEALKEHQKDVKSELKKVQSQLKPNKVKRAGNVELVHELSEKQKLYNLHLKHADRLEKQIKINAHKRDLTQQCQSWYRTVVNDPRDLPIFCTSAKMYTEHLLGSEDQTDPPDLPVEMTGIPALRQFIMRLPERSGKAEAMLHHWSNRVPTVLNAIRLSCQGFKHMMKRDDLHKILSDTHLAIPIQYRRVREEFQAQSVTALLSTIELSEPRWVEKAGKQCDKWSNFTGGGYLSFLRHEGTWRTAKCGAANFNRDFLQIVADDLNPAINTLCNKGLRKLADELKTTLLEHLDTMERNIRANIDTKDYGGFRDFFDNIRRLKKDIEVCINTAMKALGAEVQYLRYSSLTESNTNPFCEKMSPIYKAASLAIPNKDHRTKHGIRTYTFRARVTEEKVGPFMAIKPHFEQQLNMFIQEIERKVLVKCDDVFEKITHDLNNVCPQHDMGTSGAGAERLGLCKQVDQTHEKLNEVRALLAKCGLIMD